MRMSTRGALDFTTPRGMVISEIQPPPLGDGAAPIFGTPFRRPRAYLIFRTFVALSRSDPPGGFATALPADVELPRARVLRAFDRERVGEGPDEVDKAGLSVRARVEGRVEASEDLAEVRKGREAVVLLHLVERSQEDLPRGVAGGGLEGGRRDHAPPEVLRRDEHVAPVPERHGGLRLPDPHHEEARLPDPGRETGVVAVARDEAEPPHELAVEDVHRVDDHRAVGGVLPAHVRELLDRDERVLLEDLLPAVHLRG